MRFDGRVAIVTGAGKGLGRAYALDLAARGCRLVVNNRRREGAPSSADDVVAAIRAQGGEAHANHDSVEDRAAGPRLVAQALDAFGRLDILVNNAGVDQQAALHTISIAEFERIFNINFYGSVFVTHAALEPMRAARYGRILFSTSSAGLHGLHGLAAYSAAKGALVAFMRALNQEGSRHNILANAVAPYAATGMTRDAMPPGAEAAYAPELVAPLVAWLASDHCRTGGATIVAGARRFRRAEAIEGDGIRFRDDEPLTPESIGARWGEIASLDGARGFPDALAAFADFAKGTG
jgi:NAD(P)-dependent dehydrogenase (short-subunit alcohol dehydrogenase family)